jgi:glycerol-3-phosphate dehydrogenase
MKRDLERLSNERFDLLVIGGGITGACVARDAALRGLSVALVEKNDFACATSAHNSRLIHGGLRYLRNFELGLVRESLRERRIWQRVAPHLVHPLPFLIPLYGAGWKARAQLAAGLTLYDVLSFDRGWLPDPAQRLPGHRWLDARAALDLEPSLEEPGFVGAFEYHDAQMNSPERLALEIVKDAAANGAATANHLAAMSLLLRDNRAEGATVSDQLTGQRFDVRASMTLIAAGPWADLFLARALGHPASHKLMRSKGIHLVVPAMTRSRALTVAANGGHFFVLPWRGFSLLGTTDTAYEGSPDDVGVTEQDIESFLKFINAHLPAPRLVRGDVRHFYAGLRPLVDDGSGDTYDASRRAELIDHGKDDGVAGLFSAIGGKWTTSRDLAEKTVDVIAARAGKTVGACTTSTTILRPPPNSHTAKYEDEVLQDIRDEMALTLEDVVMRRIGIGQTGDPGGTVLNDIAATMAAELTWDDARKRCEINLVKGNFHTRHDS